MEPYRDVKTHFSYTFTKAPGVSSLTELRRYVDPQWKDVNRMYLAPMSFMPQKVSHHSFIFIHSSFIHIHIHSYSFILQSYAFPIN